MAVNSIILMLAIIVSITIVVVILSIISNKRNESKNNSWVNNNVGNSLLNSSSNSSSSSSTINGTVDVMPDGTFNGAIDTAPGTALDGSFSVTTDGINDMMVNSAIDSVTLPDKESFFVTSQNAYVDPVTGAIKGPGIMTDGMTRKNMGNIAASVAASGFGSDDPGALGVSIGGGFDKAYNAQLEIDNIDKRAVDGYQQQRDLDMISRKINSSENNFNNNLYIRTSKPTKMVIEPNGIRGVIDAKYLPDRDKNYQIATVSTAVPVQGYDVNIERIGEYLTNTHFSKVSHNGKHRRIPTAAGATGGGNRVNRKDTNIEDLGSANADAIARSIKVNGNNAVVENNGDTLAIPLETPSAGETFRSTYIKGNHM